MCVQCTAHVSKGTNFSFATKFESSGLPCPPPPHTYVCRYFLLLLEKHACFCFLVIQQRERNACTLLFTRSIFSFPRNWILMHRIKKWAVFTVYYISFKNMKSLFRNMVYYGLSLNTYQWPMQFMSANVSKDKNFIWTKSLY